MNAQELLQMINNSCFMQLGDINFKLTERIKKELTKEVGDFEIVSEKYYKGKEDVEIFYLQRKGRMEIHRHTPQEAQYFFRRKTTIHSEDP
jgi:hypothetical protein